MTNPQLTSLDALLQELYSVAIASTHSNALAQAMAQWKAAIAIEGSTIDPVEILTRLESVEKRIQADKRKLDRPQDEEWIASLKASPAFEGIDVPREFAKMQLWCSTNGKQPTRRRFLNWLNRCERPLASNGLANIVSPVNQYIRSNELKGVEERMRKIRAGYEPHQSWTANDITEFRSLKTRRDDLKKQLGYQV